MTPDREALRKAAASRRNDTAVSPSAVVWHCDFCARDFFTENGLMQHFCKEREKLDVLRSPTGQAAYAFYSEWMHLQRRSVPPPETFQASRQFNHMVKFAQWVDKVSIPNPKQFIKLMVDSSTIPALWCRDSTYALYLQWYDNAYPPEQQFIETLDFLKALARDEKVQLGQVFTRLTASQLIALIRKRKISPWFLIMSQSFLHFARELEPDQAQQLNDAINFGAFIDKVKARPELAVEMKAACKAEGV